LRRRTGNRRRDLRHARPSLYDRPVAFGAAPRPPAQRAARSDPRQSARSVRAAFGLLVPAALPAGDAALRRGGTAAAPGRGRPSQRLLRAATPGRAAGAGMTARDVLFELRDLRKYFPVKRGILFD